MPGAFPNARELMPPEVALNQRPREDQAIKKYLMPPTSWWANFEHVFYTVSQNFSMEPSPSHPQQVTCLMTCLVLAAFPPFPLPYRCFLGSLSDEPPHWHPGLRVCLGKLKPRHHSGFCKPGLEQTKVEAGRQVQIGKDSGLDQVAAEAFWALDFQECEGLLGAEPAE